MCVGIPFIPPPLIKKLVTDASLLDWVAQLDNYMALGPINYLALIYFIAIGVMYR